MWHSGCGVREISLQVASRKGDGGVGWNHVVQMYENFKLYGPNGTRIVIAMEICWDSVTIPLIIDAVNFLLWSITS